MTSPNRCGAGPWRINSSVCQKARPGLIAGEVAPRAGFLWEPVPKPALPPRNGALAMVVRNAPAVLDFLVRLGQPRTQIPLRNEAQGVLCWSRFPAPPSP